MIILTQIKYNKSWENNTCYNLKSLTKGWLIWNYIHIGLDGIFYIIGLFIAICSHILEQLDREGKESFEYFMFVTLAKNSDQIFLEE